MTAVEIHVFTLITLLWLIIGGIVWTPLMMSCKNNLSAVFVTIISFGPALLVALPVIGLVLAVSYPVKYCIDFLNKVQVKDSK